MPNTENYVKFILRTGYERDRESVVYSVGEPVYISDFKRLFIGDGVNYGGVLAANKFLGFTSFDYSTNSSGIVSAYRGDLVFDKTSNNLYALTGSFISSTESYARITRNFTADNVTTILNQTSGISVKPLSLNAYYLENESIGRGLEKDPDDTTQIRIKDTSYAGGLEYDLNGKLRVSPRGIKNEMLSDMAGNHIKGNLGIYGAVEDISLQDLANVLAPILERTTQKFGIPIGTIIDFGGEEPPEGYLLCNGATFSASEYPELYTAIGQTWGGTGNLFKVPDLSRKVTVGSGGNGNDVLESYVGSIGGSETIILEKSNIPSHVHSLNNFVQDGDAAIFVIDANTTNTKNLSGGVDVNSDTPVTNRVSLAYDSTMTGDGTVDGLSSGSLGSPTSIMQPSAVVTKCIKAY